eukprot:CAMPEP_0183414394 /NCGR_PEP_ID=MMETSP0370-20130417/22365_1 /TAXON_ID=268820 /ORGANISM="Peridinium aciculiferum, Strain PAER-2" /LENGTH=735 /DNA_ID=CAMNT_0025597713 /DNA_START=1 /DNA_END=2208 /DNA_ORIENTATION=-
MVMEYSASWEGAAASVDVHFAKRALHPADFGDFTSITSTRQCSVAGQERQILTWIGTTVGVETGAQPTKVAMAAWVTSSERMEKRRWYAMAAAYRTSLDSADPEAEAVADLQKALEDLQADQVSGLKAGKVFAEHRAAWAKLWESGLAVEGRLDVEQAVKSSAYYILSSLREDRPYSLSPGSLASNAYNGHTFWDTETWMYPGVLIWWPELARSLIQYRYNRLEAAEAKAKGYSPPYRGAMFSWESAFSGSETCPPDWSMGQLEQHISADIAFAVRQYYYATGDRDMLEEVGYPLVSKVAEFYVSRVTQDTVDPSKYHIEGVVPPDEYEDKGVKDSIYTNWVAKAALLFAVEVSKAVGVTPNAKWAEIAEGLVIVYDAAKKTHPEFDGYKWGTNIKQADVVLLPYPFQMPMSKESKLHDLEVYAQVTDSDGPAMTWGMHAVGYITAGKGYEAQASTNFDRSFANVKAPFDVWTETPTGGAINFITGAGGFLQAATFGYFGLRIQDGYLAVQPALMANATSAELRGIRYHGRTLSVHVRGAGAPWACHEYVDSQDENWCKTVGTVEGYEYSFDGGGAQCGGCRCCRRQLGEAHDSDSAQGLVTLTLVAGPAIALEEASTRSPWKCLLSTGTAARLALGSGPVHLLASGPNTKSLEDCAEHSAQVVYHRLYSKSSRQTVFGQPASAQTQAQRATGYALALGCLASLALLAAAAGLSRAVGRSLCREGAYSEITDDHA